MKTPLIFLINQVPAAVISVLLLSATTLVANAGSAVTQPAPNFTLKTLEGEELTLANLKGNVVLLNFWASWCSPCREEMPVLKKLHNRYEPDGLVLLGVNVEPDSKPALQTAAKLKVNFPVLLDQKQIVTELYQITAMPSTVIIDRAGNMRFVHRGFKPGAEKKYEAEIQNLIAE